MPSTRLSRSKIPSNFVTIDKYACIGLAALGLKDKNTMKKAVLDTVKTGTPITHMRERIFSQHDSLLRSYCASTIHYFGVIMRHVLRCDQESSPVLRSARLDTLEPGATKRSSLHGPTSSTTPKFLRAGTALKSKSAARLGTSVVVSTRRAPNTTSRRRSRNWPLASTRSLSTSSRSIPGMRCLLAR